MLGEAFREALGDKAGVRRFASGLFPLDEALVEVALDLSGRPFVVCEVEIPECLPLGNPPFDPQLAEQRSSSFATAAGITLHVTLRARPQRAPHHRGDRSRAWPAACATRCGSRAPGAVDQGRAVSPWRPAAGRGARLRHRQPALGAEGARALGADARLTADHGLIARRRRGGAARRRRVRGVHGRARATPASRTPSHRRRRVAAGRSSASASACRCCSTAARRTPARRARRDPGHDPLDPAGREAAADAVEPARRSTPAGRPDVRRARRAMPWVYFVHSLHGVPDDPDGRRRDVRYGGAVNAAFRQRQRVRHAVPPGEVGRTAGLALLGNFVRIACAEAPVIALMAELLYPAIDLRGGKSVRLRQGDYGTRDRLRRRPRRRRPCRSPTPARRGSTSSTSTRRAPVTPVEPAGRRRHRRGVRRAGARADRWRRAHGRRRAGARRRRRRAGGDGLGGRARPGARRRRRAVRRRRRRPRPPRRRAGRARVDRGQRRAARRAPCGWFPTAARS